jgi:hypothetical protein
LGDKGKVKVKSSLSHVIKAYRGIRGIAPLILNLDTRWSPVVIFMPQLLYSEERTPVPIEEEAGWGPGPEWLT